PRHQHPIIEIEDDALLIALFLRAGKISAGTVFGRQTAHAERSQIVASLQWRLVQNFRPGKNRVAAKAGRDMTPAINGRHQNRIAKPVEGKRARKRNDMAAIDEAAA